MHVEGLAHLHAEGAGQFCKFSKVLLHVSYTLILLRWVMMMTLAAIHGVTFSMHKGLFKKAESSGEEPFNFLKDILGKGAIYAALFMLFYSVLCVTRSF